MSRFQRIALGFLIIAAVVLWAAVGYKFKEAWQQPLGPQLALPTYTAAPETITPTPFHGASLYPFAGPTNTLIPGPPTLRPIAGPTNTLIPGPPTLTPFIAEAGKQPLCGAPATMTILLIGSSTHNAGYLYGLADVIRLVRVDFAGSRVTVLEFPRDLWVEIPDIDSRYNITHGKLNQPYFYGNKGMNYYNGPGEGPGLLARTLDLNFGARPNHYVAINMQTFVRLINNIGGIDIYLPRSVDGRQADQAIRSDLFFRAGPHHLNGDQALMLARIRQNTVFERADQQNRIFCAVRNALFSPKNLTKLPQIINTFDGAVQTDLSPQQISQLACLAPQLQPQNIIFAGFPTNLLTGSRTYDPEEKKNVFIWEADFNMLRLYVNAFNAGVWPQPAPQAGPKTPAPTDTSLDQTGFTCK